MTTIVRINDRENDFINKRFHLSLAGRIEICANENDTDIAICSSNAPGFTALYFPCAVIKNMAVETHKF